VIRHRQYVAARQLSDRDLSHRRPHDGAGALVGLVVEIAGGRPGPWRTLDACADTVPFGDESARARTFRWEAL
jgi:hypothetical protein